MNNSAIMRDPESNPLPAGLAAQHGDLAARPGNWWRSPAICALLAVMTLVAFWPLLHADFVNYDDPGYIYENAHVRQGLCWSSVQWACTAMIQYNWHPLTWLSHMLDAQLFGVPTPSQNVSGPHALNAHHAMNLAFHIANSIALFLLLQWLTRSTWCSAAVAAFFAVHPMHVESVAWASERKDQLSTLLGFATIAVYVCYTRRAGIRRYALYGAVVLLFALGLMAKPMLVTLPCLLLLIDYWPLDRDVYRTKEGGVGLHAQRPAALAARSFCDVGLRPLRGKNVLPALFVVLLSVRSSAGNKQMVRLARSAMVGLAPSASRS